MLKTWKQPVAGSMDTRPVFSPDLVRPIENALMRAKAAMMPQGQVQGHLPGRPRAAVPPHRETPTPPGIRSASGTPANHQQPHQYPNGGQPAGHPYGQYNHVSVSPSLRLHADRLTSCMQPHSNQATPQPSMPPFQAPPQNPYGSFAPPGNAVDTLNSDIHNLIAAMRAEVSQNPHDTSLHTRLGALQELQRIVQSTSLPPDQLELIRKQVTDLASVTLRASSAAVQKSTPPAFIPPQAAPPPQPASSSVAPISAPAAAPSAVTLDSLLGAGAMAALMARSGSQNSTPQPQPPAFASAAIRSPQPAPAEPYRANPPPQSQPQGGGASSLLDQLRAAGLIPAATPPQNVPVAPAPASAPPALSKPIIPPNIASLLSSGTLAAALAGAKRSSAGPSSASLTIP